MAKLTARLTPLRSEEVEMSGSYEYRISAADTSSCEFCGESHLGGRCPYVKKLERYESGAVKMVEFFSADELYAKINPAYGSPIQNSSPWHVGDFPNHVVVGGPQVTIDAWRERGTLGSAIVTTTAPASGEYFRPTAVSVGYGTSGGTVGFNTGTPRDFVGMHNDPFNAEQLAAILREAMDNAGNQTYVSTEFGGHGALGGLNDA